MQIRRFKVVKTDRVVELHSKAIKLLNFISAVLLSKKFWIVSGVFLGLG